MKLSEYLKIEPDVFSNVGVLNVELYIDSRYFVNLAQLKKTEIPEFKNSYNKIIEKFKLIADKLFKSIDGNDQTFWSAYSDFHTEEINELNLGVGLSLHGKGIGKKLKTIMLRNIMQIYQSAFIYPELFYLSSIFVPGIGADKLSDLIGTIIRDDFMNYSKRIFNQLDINELTYPNIQFENDIPINNKKMKMIFLVPLELLKPYPIDQIFIGSDDFICHEYLRDYFNTEIQNDWKHKRSIEQKNIILNKINNEEILNRIKDLNNQIISQSIPYNFTTDIEVGDYLFYNEIYPTMKFICSNSHSISTVSEILNLIVVIINHEDSSKLFLMNDQKADINYIYRSFLSIFEYINSFYNLTYETTPSARKGIIRILNKINNQNDTLYIKVLKNSTNFQNLIELIKSSEPRNKNVIIFDFNENHEKTTKIHKLAEDNKQLNRNVIIISIK